MKIHLIGIGGTGMGALAGLLTEAGHEVRGSDGPLYPPMSTLLDRLGVTVMEGFSPDNLRWGEGLLPDLVVVGNICTKDHPEAAAAGAMGLRRVSFPELLGELFLEGRRVAVAAGTHGKTTTSSLLAHLLVSAGEQPGYLIGGIPENLGRSYSLIGDAGAAGGGYFVVEGDEYDCAFFDKRPKFVHYRPHTVILTGVEFDHADIYPTMADVEHAFSMLVERVPEQGRILVCADSEVAVRLCRAARCTVQTYSARGEAFWRGEVSAAEDPDGAGAGKQKMRVLRRGEPVLELTVPMSGRHNMENALGVAAAALDWGIDPERVRAGLGSFAGVRRRQQVVGLADGVEVIDDFAHHPTAIRETLLGLRDGVPPGGRLWAVFEPRSATSKRRVFQEAFVEALGVADAVVLARLNAPEKVPEAERLQPERVIEDLRGAGLQWADLARDTDEIQRILLERVRPKDRVVVMSSGGFDGLPVRLVEALRARQEQEVGR